MSRVIERLLHIANHPAFSELRDLKPILESSSNNVLCNEDSLRRSAGIGILASNPEMIKQITETIPDRFSRVADGRFQDFRREYNSAILAAKNYIFEESPRPTYIQKKQTLDFILDFMIQTCVFEYPLLDTHQRYLGQRAAEMAYLIAIAYATREALSTFGLSESLKFDRKDPRYFVQQFGSQLLKEVNQATSLGELEYIAASAVLDGRLPSLRKNLDTVAGLIGKRNHKKRDQFYLKIGNILTRADTLGIIAEKCRLLSNLYAEYLQATVKGYKPELHGRLSSTDKISEKKITAVLNILGPALDRCGCSNRGLQFVANFNDLLRHTALFAYETPQFVVKRMKGYKKAASLVYIPLVNFENNWITYSTTVNNYLREHGFHVDFTDQDRKPFIDRDCAYAASAKYGPNIFFTAHVDTISAQNVDRGEQPDAVKAVFMPMRYAVFSGSSYQSISTEATRFEGFLKEKKIIAEVLDIGGIVKAMKDGFGYNSEDIANLEKTGALSRASPFFDILSQMVTSKPGEYSKRI